MNTTTLSLTLTLTVNQKLKTVAKRQEPSIKDILGAWAAICKACLQAKLDRMSVSLINNKSRIVIIDNNFIGYLDVHNVYHTYDYAEAACVGDAIAAFDTMPIELSKRMAKLTLESLFCIDEIIGTGTKQEHIKNTTFKMLYHTLEDIAEHGQPELSKSPILDANPAEDCQKSETDKISW